MAGPYPNDQGAPGAAIPVRLVLPDESAFYTAGAAAPTGFQHATALTVGAAAISAGNSILVSCSVPGTAAFVLEGGDSVTGILLSPGTYFLQLSITRVVTFDGTAVFYNVS